MIRELTKNYIKNNGPTYICVCKGDDIYDIEWMLIDIYNCYYWNDGDIHQDTHHHIGDIYDDYHYFRVSYLKRRDLLFLNETNSRPINYITSKIMLREQKIKRLKEKICVK